MTLEVQIWSKRSVDVPPHVFSGSILFCHLYLLSHRSARVGSLHRQLAAILEHSVDVHVAHHGSLNPKPEKFDQKRTTICTLCVYGRWSHTLWHL